MLRHKKRWNLHETSMKPTSILHGTCVETNIKLGLTNPAVLINPSAKQKCNLKTGGPPGLINRLART